MNRAELTKKLAGAKTAAERDRLLADNARLADEKLALALKDLCYATWTSEPTMAQRAAAALKSLYKFKPAENIRPFSLWVSGIADLTRGKLESAIGNLDHAAGAFLKLSREQDAAQTRVARLIALALLGRYDEAVQTGEQALKVFKKYGDELAAGKVEKNLGNIVSRQDLHLKAEKYYLSARKRFVNTGEKSEQIMAENGLAITYTHLNDFRRAEKFFAEALRNAQTGNMLLTEAEIEASMGNLALFRGRYDEALRFLELSRRKYEELGMPHQTAVAGLEIADIYRELNLTREALDIYAEVSETFSRLKLQGEEARARANFGRAAAALGLTAAARSNLKKSARLYEREKNKTGAGATMLIEAGLEIAQNNPKKALAIVREAEKLLASSESLRHKLASGLLKAEALGRTGHRMRSEKLLVDTVKEAEVQEQSNIVLAGLNSIGKLARARGDNKTAKEYFKKAVALVERLRAPLAAEEFRMAFLANKLEPFENLASIYIEESDFREAFLYTEKAKSRALAEILGQDGEIIQAEISPAASNKLAHMREGLNWYYSRLGRAGDAEIGKLQDQIKLREKEIAVLMRRIESTLGARGKTSQTGIDLKGLQNRLGVNQALVEFVEHEGIFSAFVIDGKAVSFAGDLAHGEEIIKLLEGLHFQFGAMRYGATVPKKFIADLKNRADVYLQKLYDLLIRPLESCTGGGRGMVIVPAGALYYVPFHALHDGSSYVVESCEVVYSPSAAVWQALQEKPHRNPKNALLMGFADDAIPLVNREINTLKKILPRHLSLTGKDATFTAYIKNAPRFDLLHLACHGQFRPENPLFSSLHLADGWITVRDICAQRLRAGLVVLSACETGMNKIFAGDEILGLARGFLSAGASSLVLSLWTVSDEATSRLMKRFYENLQLGQGVAASLRIAQIEFIKRGEHPYLWSPFAVIGR
jgi:tetratricopeptide (TPR) repeat protein